MLLSLLIMKITLNTGIQYIHSISESQYTALHTKPLLKRLQACLVHRFGFKQMDHRKGIIYLPQYTSLEIGVKSSIQVAICLEVRTMSSKHL